MSLTEALGQMIAERKKVAEIMTTLVDNLPEPGEIQADLEKQKTKKEFDKKKKQWKDKLDKADWAVVSIEPAIDHWNSVIPLAMKARNEVRKRNDATKQALDAVAERIEVNNRVFKAAGLALVDGNKVAELQKHRELFSEATKSSDEAGRAIDAEKQLVGKASATAAQHAKRRDEANVEYNKYSDFVEIVPDNKSKGKASKPSKR